MKNILTVKDIERSLQSKKEHLEAFYILVQKQDELMQKLDMAGLMDNLSSRQRHIRDVERLEEKMPDRRLLLSNSSCARLSVEINDVIRSIQVLDTQNQQKVRDRLVFLKGNATGM